MFRERPPYISDKSTFQEELNSLLESKEHNTGQLLWFESKNAAIDLLQEIELKLTNAGFDSLGNWDLIGGRKSLDYNIAHWRKNGDDIICIPGFTKDGSLIKWSTRVFANRAHPNEP